MHLHSRNFTTTFFLSTTTILLLMDKIQQINGSTNIPGIADCTKQCCICGQLNTLLPGFPIMSRLDFENLPGQFCAGTASLLLAQNLPAVGSDECDMIQDENWQCCTTSSTRQPTLPPRPTPSPTISYSPSASASASPSGSPTVAISFSPSASASPTVTIASEPSTRSPTTQEPKMMIRGMTSAAATRRVSVVVVLAVTLALGMTLFD